MIDALSPGRERHAAENEFIENASVVNPREYLIDLRGDDSSPLLEYGPNVLLLLRPGPHQLAAAITVLGHGEQILPLQYGLDLLVEAPPYTPEDEQSIGRSVLF
jgi:hypothetical protein